jgi:hypothetical protein
LSLKLSLPGQRIFVVRREDYAFLVPFVEDEHTVFLKTIIPSRKATKQYLGEESVSKPQRHTLTDFRTGRQWAGTRTALVNGTAFIAS